MIRPHSTAAIVHNPAAELTEALVAEATSIRRLLSSAVNSEKWHEGKLQFFGNVVFLCRFEVERVDANRDVRWVFDPLVPSDLIRNAAASARNRQLATCIWNHAHAMNTVWRTHNQALEAHRHSCHRVLRQLLHTDQNPHTRTRRYMESTIFNE